MKTYLDELTDRPAPPVIATHTRVSAAADVEVFTRGKQGTGFIARLWRWHGLRAIASRYMAASSYLAPVTWAACARQRHGPPSQTRQARDSDEAAER